MMLNGMSRDRGSSHFPFIFLLMERIHIIVQGRVQGVGFRYHTQQKALELGITGYVKNQPDGSVEVVAEGSPAQLNQLIAWVKQGPPAAAVTHTDMTYESPKGEFNDFSIRR